MGWAATGSVMAVCGYALLFPPFGSVPRALTFAALCLIALLATTAHHARWANAALARFPAPTAFVPPVVVGVLTSALTVGAESAWLLMHEAAATSALALIAAACAEQARQQRPGTIGHPPAIHR